MFPRFTKSQKERNLAKKRKKKKANVVLTEMNLESA